MNDSYKIVKNYDRKESGLNKSTRAVSQNENFINKLRKANNSIDLSFKESE